MSMSREIREAMDARGITQAEVCAATGISPSLFSRMLRDDEHNYTLKTLRRIAAALDTELIVEFEPPTEQSLVVGGITITNLLKIGNGVTAWNDLPTTTPSDEEIIFMPRGGREYKIEAQVVDDFNLRAFLEKSVIEEAT